MVSDTQQLHILFFPLMSPGHFIPMIDMACMFTSYKVRSTVVCTPANASKIPATKSKLISIVTIPFPSPDVTKLPPNNENMATIPPSMYGSFVAALRLLKDPLSQVIADLKPDCLVSDAILLWTVDVALQFNIPRIVFHGPHVFPMYIYYKIFSHFPLEELEEEFWTDGVGEKIKLYKKGLPDLFNDSLPFLLELVEAEARSYGVLVNTYRDMELAYVDWYKEFKKGWCVGPVTMASIFDKEKEGGWMTETEVVKGEIVNWLDGKEEGSVLYVCFGSMNYFTPGQLRELALGLEKSGKNFLWVVRKEPKEDDEKEKDWMPEDYRRRVGDRGFVVKGWAPQNAVLGHKATGWFLTHCGSTSVQESTCAGVPMITWPLFHEQFANVEFIVQTMGIGERMWEGFRKSELKDDDDVIVTADEIAEVVGRVMGGGEKYDAMKKKAKDYREKAKEAVKEGGSSYNDILSFIHELKTLRKND